MYQDRKRSQENDRWPPETEGLPAQAPWLPSLTFSHFLSSIRQEPGMGTMGLALPWKARIPSVPRERGTRVEPSEHFTGGPNLAAVEAQSEDAALAAAYRSGDLRAYERLY